MKQLELIQPATEAYTYIPDFLGSYYARELLNASKAYGWQQNEITMMGQSMPLPRLEVMFGDSPNYEYNYSKSVILKASPWPEMMRILRRKVERHSGYKFQIVIGNLYRSGKDSIGYHADNDISMGYNPAIASISLGGTRTFRIKRNGESKSISIDLVHGSLLIMHPGMQSTHKHCLPKTKRDVGERINWTFRPYTGGDRR